MILAVVIRCNNPSIHARVAAAPEPHSREKLWGLSRFSRLLRAHAQPTARILNSVEPFKAARSLLPSLVNCVQQPTSGSAKQFPGPFVVTVFHARRKAWDRQDDVQKNSEAGA